MGVSAPAAPERPPSKRKGVLIGGMFAALILLFGSVIVITNANARAAKEKQERAQAEFTRRNEEAARAKKAAELAARPCVAAGTPFFENSLKRLKEFRDGVDVADVTARIALPSQVARLQEIARAYEEVDTPPCALVVRQKTMFAMKLTIMKYLGFMSQSPDAYLLEVARSAKTAWEDSGVELDKALKPPAGPANRAF